MNVDLTVANFFFLACFIAPAFVAVALLVSAFRSRSRTTRRIVSLFSLLLVTLAAHPVAQFWVLEPLDQRRGNAMKHQADDSDLVGKTRSEVRATLGSPSVEYSSTPGRETWEYKQVTGYWLGSHFQVFFEQDTVYGYEPNDD
jgi:hypothetical protein